MLKPELIKLLDALTPEDVVRVQKRLSARLSRSGYEGVTAEDALSSPELFVLSALADYSQRAGIGVEGVERLRASKNFPAFREKVAGLNKLLDRQKDLDQRQRRLLLMFGFELLHEDITRNATVAASARTLMDWVHRLPAVFDSHFPGYAANGLLGITVKRQLKGVNEE